MFLHATFGTPLKSHCLFLPLVTYVMVVSGRNGLVQRCCVKIAIALSINITLRAPPPQADKQRLSPVVPAHLLSCDRYQLLE